MSLTLIRPALAALGALAIVPALTPSSAGAGAFQIREGSARAQGSSLAGRTSGAGDVSFALRNPAALSGVTSHEVSVGLAGIFASADATADVSVPGFRSTDNPSEAAVVPSFAFGRRITQDLVIGLAVDAPFGLSTKYDEDFVGSFQGVESELINVVATPMIAWEFSPGLSFGAGVSIGYAEATFTNRTFDATRSVAEVTGDGVSVGFRLGAQAELGERTVVGAAFHSAIDYNLEGDFTDNYVIPPVGSLGGPAKANFDAPASVSLGVTHGVGERWRVMAEVEWIGWERFEDITLQSESTGVRLAEPQNYSNSWTLAFGAEWDATDDLTLRGGVAWDQTPTPDAERTVRVPDADRYWLSVGASYAITDAIAVDAAYTYVIFEDTSVALSRPVAGRISYESDAHVIGLNARYRF